MSTINYAAGCDEALGTHFCDPCPEQEGARVSSVIVSDDFDMTDPEELAEYQAAIQAGTMRLIPDVRGSFDGGTPEYGKGYGRVSEVYKRSKFKLTFFDPNLKQNWSFYDGLKRARDKRIYFVTETLIWIATVPASWFAKPVITEETTDIIDWQVDVTWDAGSCPRPYDLPDGLIDCFTVEA